MHRTLKTTSAACMKRNYKCTFPITKRTRSNYSFQPVNKNVTNTFISELRAVLPPEKISLHESTRIHHGTSLTYHKPMPPDVVLFPRFTQDVSKIVSICYKHRVPIIPYGAGTALEGHFDALYGGVSLDLTEMNNIVHFYPDDMNVTVEAGVTREALNAYVKENGLFFPIDPGANATIGGMASTRASGTNAVKFGTMKDNILNLTCVLPDEKGTVIKTNRRAKKSSAGYDLTSMMIGSEGTLAVITEITLKLYGIPESIIAAVCSFPDMNSAAQCVSICIQMGVPLARIELMDQNCIKAVNKYSNMNLDDSKPMLLFEFYGSREGIREQVDLVKQIAQEDFHASDFIFKQKEEERQMLWKARHMAYIASLNLRPGYKGFITDVCVPISRLAECIVATQEDVNKTGLVYTVVGHVGDGNFHVILVLDENNPEEMRKAHEVNEKLVKRAIDLDGTCTGEHGVGHGKMDCMLYEHGPDAVELMRSIKRAIDPLNIMNPGKVIPHEDVVRKYGKL